MGIPPSDRQPAKKHLIYGKSLQRSRCISYSTKNVKDYKLVLVCGPQTSTICILILDLFTFLSLVYLHVKLIYFTVWFSTLLKLVQNYRTILFSSRTFQSLTANLVTDRWNQPLEQTKEVIISLDRTFSFINW